MNANLYRTGMIRSFLGGMACVAFLFLHTSFVFAGESATDDRLNNSPRHHEWVDVKSGDHVVKAFVVYPEVEGKVTAVIVIHENKGLNDWARSAADQVAEAGYIAVAPDLLSGKGPEGGDTASFASADEASKGIYKLDQAEVTVDLDAVADYAKSIPAANGKVAVSGFCWGGGQTFKFAAHRLDLAAAFVFYGPAPDDGELLKKIETPVHGFYGGNDARITGGVDKTIEAMKAAGKTYEPVVYEGAGHGFMRSGEAPDAKEADRKAREEAWKRWKDLLAKL